MWKPVLTTLTEVRAEAEATGEVQAEGPLTESAGRRAAL